MNSNSGGLNDGRMASRSSRCSSRSKGRGRRRAGGGDWNRDWDRNRTGSYCFRLATFSGPSGLLALRSNIGELELCDEWRGNRSNRRWGRGRGRHRHRRRHWDRRFDRPDSFLAPL